ncbi:MAG: Gfo/Idh/MocA family oxidoreductase, partial [Planctomycetia bacterium]|nr:Gfo/Idh/MocA family oxidoreductase [Planctomycetia bacterium]
MKGAAATVVAGGLAPSLMGGMVSAEGSDVIRVGLIGCGGRGSGAASNCVNSAEGVKLTAMADLFADRLNSSRMNLKGLGDKYDVSDEQCFVGFDAYEKLLATDVDLVILATPPGFRPIHFEAAIEAGKHVFMEKPVATDGPGIRQVLKAAKKAKEKNLG